MVERGTAHVWEITVAVGLGENAHDAEESERRKEEEEVKNWRKKGKKKRKETRE